MANEYAFVLPYEDEQGNVYPASYWPVDFQASSRRDKGARCTFVGYRNRQAFLDGKAPIPGAERSYATTGPDSWLRFKAWYDANPQHVYGACMFQALQAQEIGDLPAQGQPDTRVSFFKDAEVV